MTNTQQSIVAQQFDEKFGTDGPDKNSDSIGRKAGCDDCSMNIELRAEHKAFLLQVLEQKETEWKEGFDRVSAKKIPVSWGRRSLK